MRNGFEAIAVVMAAIGAMLVAATSNDELFKAHAWVLVITLGVFALFLLRTSGPLWACLAAGVAYSSHAACGLWLVKRQDSVAIVPILRELLPAIVACVPMVLAVLGIRYLLNDSLGVGWLLLISEVVTGMITYVVAMRVFSPKAFRGVVAQLTTVIFRRAQNSDLTE